MAWRLLSIITCILFLSSCTTPYRTPASTHPIPRYELSLEKRTLFNGSLLRVYLKFIEPLSSDGIFPKATASIKGLGLLQVPFFGGAIQEAWLGIPYDTAAGEYEVVVHLGDGQNERIEILPLSIRVGHYPTQALRVDPKLASPSELDQKRIEQESAITRAIYQKFSLNAPIKKEFHFPLKAKIRSKYGLRRTFNGKPSGYHAGLDFKAQYGVAVPAAEAGSVALAQELFLCGNAVILDHGYGIFTVYCHLSHFDVKAGDAVQKGQTLGRVGSTGRSTGPHLHWSTVVGGGVFVNPVDLSH